jgi:hypothetical protein
LEEAKPGLSGGCACYGGGQMGLSFHGLNTLYGLPVEAKQLVDLDVRALDRGGDHPAREDIKASCQVGCTS